MSGKQVKQFSTKAAKVVAGFAARLGTVWCLSFLVKHSILPADWLTDPQHLATAATIITMLVYEIEEQVWERWGWDIPGILTHLGLITLDMTKPVDTDAQGRAESKSTLPTKDDILGSKGPET